MDVMILRLVMNLSITLSMAKGMTDLHLVANRDVLAIKAKVTFSLLSFLSLLSSEKGDL